jgi:polyhydroxyalkanoate synthesis regulator phasin
MHSVGSINIPLLLGIIIALGAFFLVDTNISIHALDKEQLILYDYFDLAQFADTIKDGDKEIEEISLKLMQSSNSFSTLVPDTDTGAPDTDTGAPDTDTSASDDEENILINQLVNTGKFTEDEAKELVTRVANGTDGASTADDTLDSDSPATSETDTSTNETPMTPETDTSTNDTTSSDNQNNVDESSSKTNNPEEYDNLNGLVDDIKNGDIDTDEISLDAFQDSGAYQGTDKETQDCIDLAGKIGQNLGDNELVHCFDDANYFRDKYS